MSLSLSLYVTVAVTVSITISVKFLFHFHNFRFYRIIVVLLKKTGNEKLKNPKSYERLYSYNEIMDLTKEERYGKAYIAFAFKAEDFDKYQRFVLGNGTSFENEFSRRKRENKEYRNGKLTPGSDYAYHLRGYVNKVTFLSRGYAKHRSELLRREGQNVSNRNVVVISSVAYHIF